MLFTDPIPTPAARAGRAAIVLALAGWVALAASAGLYLLSVSVRAGDEHLATSLRVACGWAVGPAVVAFLAGTIAAAAGVTRQMNGVPDPGLKVVVLGFCLNGLPMVLVAMGGAYDKVGRKFLEGKKKPVASLHSPALPAPAGRLPSSPAPSVPAGRAGVAPAGQRA